MTNGTEKTTLFAALPLCVLCVVVGVGIMRARRRAASMKCIFTAWCHRHIKMSASLCDAARPARSRVRWLEHRHRLLWKRRRLHGARPSGCPTPPTPPRASLIFALSSFRRRPSPTDRPTPGFTLHARLYTRRTDVIVITRPRHIGDVYALCEMILI